MHLASKIYVACMSLHGTVCTTIHPDIINNTKMPTLNLKVQEHDQGWQVTNPQPAAQFELQSNEYSLSYVVWLNSVYFLLFWCISLLLPSSTHQRQQPLRNKTTPNNLIKRSKPLPSLLSHDRESGRFYPFGAHRLTNLFCILFLQMYILIVNLQFLKNI